MSDNLRKDRQVILCDMCTDEERKPARKTCMKCEISMCVQHLQAHLTTPVLLQTHPLTEPMSSGSGGLAGVSKCPMHGKLLEYYCLDDLTCVCVSCAIEDQHRLHNMKTFPTAHKELLEKVRAEQQVTEGENSSLERWEKSEREKLGRSSARLIEAVTGLHNLVLTSVQSSVSARLVAIKTSRSSLQAVRNEEDTFRFLQMYSQVNQDLEKAKAVDLRRGLEPGSDRDKLVQEIKQNGEKIKEQMSQFCGSLLTHVDPENHQESSSYRSDLCFDIKTLSSGLTLSKDYMKVYHRGELKRGTVLLKSITSVSSRDKYRWVMRLSKDFDWTIGLCDKNHVKELNNGDMFGLCWKGNQLNSVTTEYQEALDTAPMQPNTTFTYGIGTVQNSNQGPGQRVSNQVISPLDETGEQTTRPEKVEVIWDSQNSMSFYNLTDQYQRRKMTTITIKSTNQHLTPFVLLETEGSQGVSGGLFGQPSGSFFGSKRSQRVSGGLFGQTAGLTLGAPPQRQHEQWICSCGQTYNPSNYRGGFGQKYPQQLCPCGEIIGASRITEVLCELL